MAGMENTSLSHRFDEYRSRPCYESTVPRCMRRMTSLNCSQSLIDDPWLVYRREESSAVCYSLLEQHERFGLLLYQSVPLPPETWVRMYDGGGGPGITAVVLSTFVFHCVDYSVLLRYNVNNSTAHQNIFLHISDAVLPMNECVANVGALTWVCLLVAVIFWILRAVKFMYRLLQFWDIKQFFNTALEISDSDLDKLIWQEIQRKMREVQLEQQMCIHKRDLTELDIYHRILRFENYMVAMVNKSLFPIRLRLPFLGEVVFLTRGLTYNIELLLYWGPWAPFENNWRLKEDYKKVGRRTDLAQLLSKHILWVGIANFVTCSLILLLQILYAVFTYAEAIKCKPGILSSRCWSLYGRLYLRHFNELDHELNARLNRAYTPASEYMNIFTCPMKSSVARNVANVAGACPAVLVILSAYNVSVLTVKHILTAIIVLGAIVAVSRTVIPDENLVRRPEEMLTAVLAHVHYQPDSWRGQAHRKRVRKEFSQLFHYKAVYLLQEMLSPVITPFILCFHLRSKSLDIVDFYRNFTVEVVGVGDVCSFAQMDVRHHGNPAWQTSVTSPTEPQAPGPGGPMRPGMQFSDLVESILLGHAAAVAADLSHAEGPIHSSNRRPFYSLQQGFTTNPLGASMFGQRASTAPEMDPEFTAGDISLSILYLHELHHQQAIRNRLNRSMWQRPHQDMSGIRELGDDSGDMTQRAERTPLLDAATNSPRIS